LFITNIAFSQITNYNEFDPCGFELMGDNISLLKSEPFEYNYTDLHTDLDFWTASPYTWVQIIGLTTQERNIYMLTITDSSVTDKKYRIWIHARTHPIEFQSSYVTNEMIKLLLSDNEEMAQLRRECVFNIVPMYNPDGVELGYARYNANEIDIESNWSSDNPEKEVVVLRNTLDSLMNTQLPIDIALNMHSAYNCKRYFVFHAEGGTSKEFERMQQDFIFQVRNEWPEGIEPSNTFISWQYETALQYPESWFWINHREDVLALTYEDMNCGAAGSYDITATALMRGIGKYLEIFEKDVWFTNIASNTNPIDFNIKNNIIKVNTANRYATTSIINMQGVVVKRMNTANPTFKIANSGLYILYVQTEDEIIKEKIIISN
jgi:hypothetical protein